MTLLVTGSVLIHLWGAQLGIVAFLIEFTFPRLISTNSWVRVLDNQRADRYSAYGVLQDRKTDKAIPHALVHIHEPDDYLWLNAASYLGSRQRPEAIPYLIKSLRHSAWRSVDERIDSLTKLTGEDFGDDFGKWQEWYLSAAPDVVPDWDASLGHRPQHHQSD